jgi:predicted transcriptional regulator
MSTQTISMRVNHETASELTELAEATDRPKAWHLEQALKNYLDMHTWQIEHIKKGLADAEAGRLHPHSVAVAKINRMIAKRKRK